MRSLRSWKTIRAITSIIICGNGSRKERHAVSFVAFVAQYYEERLHFYECLDLTRCAETVLLDIAGEASALHKFLIDILEEGYAITVNRLVRQTDAFDRLQRFLSTVLPHLGGPSAREHFYLFPDLIPLPQFTTKAFAGGTIFELHAYLDHLDRLSDDPVHIASCFDDAQQCQRWQAKTQVLMTEMVAFLHWLCPRLSQLTSVVPVPLLRDTLLIHIGLLWLRRSGVPVPAPQPLMIGRKFADLCGNGRDIYGALSNVIYRVLMEEHPRDLATLRRHFATAIHADPAIPASFTQACRDYLATLVLDGTPLFIESGVQGTFPLLLLSLTVNTGDMVFYTTTPWLYPTYAPIVFQKNYHYLREMETIVAHDHLFQLKTVQDGTVLVEETTNATARCLALYEIQTFKAMLKRCMPTFAS
jgi:hypothetical protein